MSEPKKEGSPHQGNTLPDLASLLDSPASLPPRSSAQSQDDPASYTTNQWSIVSPETEPSSSGSGTGGPLRKSRIGDVIRDTSLRRKPQKFPDWAITALTQWFMDHESYPYPTPEEKEMLAQQTKLSEVQINYWFSNARRRRAKKEKRHAAGSSSQPSNSPSISAQPDPNFGRPVIHSPISLKPPPLQQGHPNPPTSKQRNVPSANAPPAGPTSSQLAQPQQNYSPLMSHHMQPPVDFSQQMMPSSSLASLASLAGRQLPPPLSAMHQHPLNPYASPPSLSHLHSPSSHPLGQQQYPPPPHFPGMGFPLPPLAPNPTHPHNWMPPFPFPPPPKDLNQK